MRKIIFMADRNSFKGTEIKKKYHPTRCKNPTIQKRTANDVHKTQPDNS
jgi:hypothetical protein